LTGIKTFKNSKKLSKTSQKSIKPPANLQKMREKIYKSTKDWYRSIRKDQFNVSFLEHFQDLLEKEKIKPLYSDRREGYAFCHINDVALFVSSHFYSQRQEGNRYINEILADGEPEKIIEIQAGLIAKLESAELDPSEVLSRSPNIGNMSKECPF